MNLPPIGSQDEWLAASQKLIDEEKEATRVLNALAAKRRRLPMVQIHKDYMFESSDGTASLLDLFEGRRQLIVYHFMFDPKWEEGCVGCSMLVDGMCHPAHLHARDTSLALISRAPQDRIEPFRARMGWTIPWYSSYNNDFNYDFGASTDKGEVSAVSVFLRDGDQIFRTYFTKGSVLETLGSHFNYLDLTPYGRQEIWEDSPEGWPQDAPFKWWRHHDKYDQATD